MLIKNYQPTVTKTLNNTILEKELNNDVFLLSYKNIKYPTKVISIFDNFETNDLLSLFDDQEKAILEEANIYLKYGYLSKKAYDFTLETYRDLFYFEGCFYKKSELKEYITKQNLAYQTIATNPYINKQNENSQNIVNISRQRIRNITGYSPFFIPKRSETGNSIYVERQDRLIQDEHDLILVLGSRQIGKSMSIGEKAVEESHIPNNDILVGAFTNSSTNTIRNYLRKFIKNFPEGYFEEQKSERYVLNTKTGSKIYFRTVGDDAVDAIRGMTLNTIIIDEAQLVSEYAFLEVLQPTLATTGGKMILIGTPPKVPQGFFAESIMSYKKGELKNTSYYEIKITDQPFTHPKVRESVMSQKDNPRIQRERFCNLTSSVDQLFEFVKTNEFPELSNNGYFVLGLDPARKGDRSGYCIIYTFMGKSYIIESGFVPDTFKGDWKLQVIFYKKIVEKYKRYSDVITVMDSTGIGDGVVSIFNDNGLKINSTIRYTSGSIKTQKGVDFTVSKSILINNLLNMISEGLIEIIDITNKDLIEEIKYIYETESKSGLISFTSKFYDDITNATMIASFITQERNLIKRSGEPRKEIPKSSGNINIDAIERRIKPTVSSVW